MRDSGLSASDVALLSGRNNDNSGFGGFGGDGAWWIIILFLFVFCGWGNGNGFGGNNGGGSVADMYTLNSDFATLSRQLDSGFDRIGNRIENVNNGLCNGFYETLSNFNTTNMNLASGFANLNNALCNQSFQIERGITGLGSQLAECCCGLRSDIQGVNYNMAMNTNVLQNAMCNNTRDIISSQENGTRAILDALTQNRIESKNEQIQAQQNEINALRLAASQEKQNAYLVDQLGTKCPVAAYLTCNPNAPLNYSIAYGNCGCNSGCGNY